MIRRIVCGLVSLVLLGSCAVERAVEHAIAPATGAPASTVRTNAERFAQAYEEVRYENYAAALPEFTDLTTLYPQLIDYHLYYIGFIQARQGEPNAARATLAHLLAQYPQSVKADEASLELGRILLERNDATAATFLERAASSDSASVRNAARLALAENAEQRGDLSRAYADLMAIRRGARGTAAAREAKKDVLRLRQRYRQLEPTGSELLDEAKLLLEERDYAAAALALERLAKALPAGIDPAAVARLDAETLLGRGRLEEGLAGLWKVADDYPRSSAAPAALFRLASLLWNRDRDTAAMRAFGELRARYPRDRRVPDAIYAIARIEDSAGREAEAIDAYGEVVRRFPRSDLAAESKWRIGWIHYRAGRWEEACVSFAELAGSTAGKRHDEAMYWRARSHENAGRGDRARQLYRESVTRAHDSSYGAYYGAWAEARLRILSRSKGSTAPFADDGVERITPPTAEEPVVPPSLPQFHVERWRELRAAGLNELARSELAAIERGQPDDPATTRFLIDAYQSVDDFRRARSLATRGGTLGLSARERRELVYPLGFWNEVSREAKARHLDPIWVVSLMRQESMFDPVAISPAGARGLMQLMPSTADRVAAELGHELHDESELLRPQVNVALGTAYLRSLTDRFDNDMLKVLAAYNGGESAVDRWQRQFGALAPDEFVESITYRETRDYVKRVAGNYRVYRELYGSADR